MIACRQERETLAAEEAEDEAIREELLQKRAECRHRKQERSGAEKNAEAAAFERISAEEEARELAREWVVLKLAGNLLDAAMERYRAGRADPVLENAGRHFGALTMGGFDALLQNYGANDELILSARRSGGGEVTVDGLSDGTRDQLYLALRLAFLEDYASRNEPAPLIVDDIFQTFDDARSAAGLKALAGLGGDIQTILFTHTKKALSTLPEASLATRPISWSWSALCKTGFQRCLRIFSAFSPSTGRVFHSVSMSFQINAFVAGDHVKVEVEDCLAGSRLIELGNKDAIGLKCGLYRPRHLLHHGHGLTDHDGIGIEQVARGLSRNNQNVARGLRHHVHNGDDVVILVEFGRRDFPAQDLRKDVVVFIFGDFCHVWHGVWLPCWRRRSFALLVGRMSTQNIIELRDIFPFMNEKLGHRVPKSLMGDVVGGMGGDRNIAAGQLVLTLGAGFDTREIIGDGVVNGLMIADLEMQETMVFDAAPVAAKKRVRAYEVDGAGNVAPVALCHNEQDIAWHAAADQRIEFARQIRPAPLATAGIDVELEELVPDLLCQVLTG